MNVSTDQLIAYFEGRLPEKERAAFEQSLQQSPELKKETDELRYVWELSAELKQHGHVNAPRNWEKLSRRIALNRSAGKLVSFLRTAAAILLIPALVATYVLYSTLQEWNNRPAERVETSTAYGLVSRITLPDGSEVWLNSGSSLSYPQRFDKGERQVRLSGEAYFKVKSDPSNRFSVTTSGGLQISAYGTEFNINAYENDPKVEATLVTGHIRVEETARALSAALQPGEQAVYYKDDPQLKIEKVNLAVKTSWKDGKMIFRRADMHEIARRLARHFNVDIRLEGKELYDYAYSATFTTETLDAILRLLEETAPIRCTIIEPEQTADLSYPKRTVIIRRIE
ncbi:MAG: DUF4974 domain-containing protein [Parabacteroides sp.]|nr:DUF4974 domain-containing protein [Parabacteroides sp.]